MFQVLLGRIRLNSDKIGDSHTIHSLFLRTVHGQWGAWGIVEECRKPCSSTRNSIKRRFCDNPKPPTVEIIVLGMVHAPIHVLQNHANVSILFSKF